MRWAAVPARSLDLALTLCSGQAFRWRQGASGDWVGAIDDVALRLRPGEDGFHWQTFPEPDRWDAVARYLALDVDLGALCDDWARRDGRVAPALERWPGLRVLRQEPVEAFFAFVCACVNTVEKVSRSVSALARRYGKPIAEVDGVSVCAFPAVEALAEADGSLLRQDLWGFRAPRVPALACRLAAEGGGWLAELAEGEYVEARKALAGLPGIGPKIADCICLFGLGHDEAVPLDTHVHRAAVSLVAPDLAGRSLTAKTYRELGDRFRDRFGPYSGWLQQALFLDEMHRAARTE